MNSPDCHHDGYEDPQHHDHDRPKHDPGYVRVENFPKLHLLTSLLIRFVSQHERTRGRSVGSGVDLRCRARKAAASRSSDGAPVKSGESSPYGMAAPHSAMARRQGRFTPVFAGHGRVLMASCGLEHDPEKACPGLDPMGADLSNLSTVMPAKAGHPVTREGAF